MQPHKIQSYDPTLSPRDRDLQLERFHSSSTPRRFLTARDGYPCNRTSAPTHSNRLCRQKTPTIHQPNQFNYYLKTIPFKISNPKPKYYTPSKQHPKAQKNTVTHSPVQKSILATQININFPLHQDQLTMHFHLLHHPSPASPQICSSTSVHPSPHCRFAGWVGSGRVSIYNAVAAFDS